MGKLCKNDMKIEKIIEKYRKIEHEKMDLSKKIVKTVHNLFPKCYNK